MLGEVHTDQDVSIRIHTVVWNIMEPHQGVQKKDETEIQNLMNIKCRSSFSKLRALIEKSSFTQLGMLGLTAQARGQS